ncbi:MAG: putative DNA binding domain-containing protein [Magnetococcales bacterium]|nr:putative DNA binding domain-containing protein [Magnetococcales bacterium]
MTKDELIAKLKKFEWNDMECKKAQRGVSEDAYRTVSAFANTSGGWLVFGVEDRNGTLEIVGVIEVDKVQNDFLSVLRAGRKFSQVINVQEDAIDCEGKILLIFHVPESNRQEKPVYLQGDIRKSFIRRGGGDEQCTQDEIKRFLRDASDHRHDGEKIQDLTAESFFAPDSVAWYRRTDNEKNPGRHVHLTDIQFLNEWGFLVETQERLIPTRAGVLLFGKGRYVRQILPRPIVDFQRIDSDFDQWSPDKRWHDRLVVEENLIQAWLSIVEKYMRLAEKPFSVEEATLRRHDAPPEYIPFRESVINLLIHQDFGDLTRTPVIKLFRDRTLFWNPGDAYSTTTEQLLDPTAKEVRNPSIVAGFRRIGLSDQAGTGLRSIFSNWQRLGCVPPTIQNDKAGKSFELVLLKEVLLTEKQELFHASLGVHLDDNQAKAFAYACRTGFLTILDVKAVTSLNGPDAQSLLKSLVVQGLLEATEEGVHYQLVSHLRDRFFPGNVQTEPVSLSTAQAGHETASLSTAQAGHETASLSTAQAGHETASLSTAQAGHETASLSTAQVQSLDRLTEPQWSVVEFCDAPRSMLEIIDRMGVSNRGYFKQKHMDPLIFGGIVRMTMPDKPQSPNQRYVLTDAGLRLKRRRMTDATNLKED